jgi:hypothetical protein
MTFAVVLAPVEPGAAAVPRFAGAQDWTVIAGARGGVRGSEDQAARDPLQAGDRDGEDKKGHRETAEAKRDAAPLGHAKEDGAQQADFGCAGEGAEKSVFHRRRRFARSAARNHAKGAKA